MASRLVYTKTQATPSDRSGRRDNWAEKRTVPAPSGVPTASSSYIVIFATPGPRRETIRKSHWHQLPPVGGLLYGLPQRHPPRRGSREFRRPLGLLLDADALRNQFYCTFQGKKIKVVLRQPVEGRRNWEGTLAAFEDGRVTLDHGGQTPAPGSAGRVQKANLKLFW